MRKNNDKGNCQSAPKAYHSPAVSVPSVKPWLPDVTARFKQVERVDLLGNVNDSEFLDTPDGYIRVWDWFLFAVFSPCEAFPPPKKASVIEIIELRTRPGKIC